MVKGRVYSSETLEPHVRERIRNGLDMIGQYLGGISVTAAHRLSLPVNNGRVKVERVGYRNFDPFTHLHIITAPLERGVQERIGVAHRGSGVAWLNTDTLPANQASIVAHETAHALGFVRPDALFRDTTSPDHCRETSCVMYKTTVPLDTEEAGLYKDLQEAAAEILGDAAFEFGLPGLNGFCTPCRADIRAYGDEHVSDIERGRLEQRVVSGQNLIRS